MGDELHEVHSERTAAPWYRQQLFFFITGSIFISILLVMVSMALYASSGAAQLDLSRPGYKSVQDKVGKSETFESFPANGRVNNETIEKFLELYNRQTRQVNDVDAFSAETLEAQALGIDAPSADNSF